MKATIIAKNIQHLTDARYFAAYGVGGIVYDLQRLSSSPEALTLAQQITEWIVGVNLIGYVMEDEGRNFEIIESLGISEIIFGAFWEGGYALPQGITKVYQEVLLENIEYISPPDMPIIINLNGVQTTELTQEQLEKINTMTSINEIYLDGVRPIRDIPSIIQRLGLTGVIVSGSDEDKIGLKSFDEMDEVFEALQD